MVGRAFAFKHLVLTLIGLSWCIAANAHDSSGELHEFDPHSNAHYSGGDLKGLIRRLDYFKQLGATALWITPTVAPRRRSRGGPPLAATGQRPSRPGSGMAPPVGRPQ